MSRTFYWSGLLALILAAALLTWSAADLFWQLLPAQRAEISDRQAAPRRNVGEDPTGGTEVADLHLFGQTGTTVQAIAFEAPETQLNLSLLGTFAADDPEAGLAIVADDQGQQGYYGAGDELPGGAQLKEVHADRIVITREGRHESLRLVRSEAERRAAGAPSSSSPGSSSSGRSGPRALPGDSRTLSGSDWQSAQQQSRLDLQKMKQLGQQIRALPFVENGEPIGVRLMSGADSAAVRKLGLRNSDIILSVNGIPLTDPGRQLELMNLLNEQTQFQVRLRRNGREMTLNVDASQLQSP